MGRRKGDPQPERQVHVTPEENAQFIMHNLEVSNLANTPCNFNEPEAVGQRIQDYFAVCIKNGKRPTVAGLSLAFGVDRRTLYAWRVGTRRAGAEESRKKLEQASAILNSLMEDYMHEGKINPVAGIFLMKNHFGYEDQRKEIHVQENPLGIEASSDELRKKYLDAVEQPKISDGTLDSEPEESIGE